LPEISIYRTVLWNAKSSLRAQDQRDWRRPAIKSARRSILFPATIDDRRVSIFNKREYAVQFVLKGSIIRLNFAALSFAATASSIF
jgi:hypothetical protein